MSQISAASQPGNMDRAFDIWLQRSLHMLYDDIASEQVPEALLKLIRDDLA